MDAIWIKRLIEAIPVEHQKVYHITVYAGEHFSLRRWNDGATHHCMWQVPTRRWIVIEFLNFILLFYYLGFKRIHARFDVINFHIAYPQLVFWRMLKLVVGKPVVIFEHWSAYHYNFGVQKRLPRIQRIFRNRLPLITVSRCLLKDIEKFFNGKVLNGFIVPNVINTRIFKRDDTVAVHTKTFLMIGQWKSPKMPEVIIHAFAKVMETEMDRSYRLRIAGYGPKLDEMKRCVNVLNLSDCVSFLGTLDSTSIAHEMNQCAAFLHCSDYETFSVVCAEAICCGTPVVASAVGGIPEFIHATNGVLINDNTVEEWTSALRVFNTNDFDRKQVSADAAASFSTQSVGLRYLDVLKRVQSVKK